MLKIRQRLMNNQSQHHTTRLGKTNGLTSQSLDQCEALSVAQYSGIRFTSGMLLRGRAIVGMRRYRIKLPNRENGC